MGFTLRRAANRDDQGRARYSSLVASAVRLDRAGVIKRKGKDAAGSSWQDLAWHHYDVCGELRNGVGWLANALSKAKLFVAKGDTDVDEPERIDSGPAVDYLQALTSGPAGQAMLLQRLGLHLGVPGESWIVGYHPEGSAEPRFAVASSEELVRRGEDLILDRGDGEPITLSEQDWTLRLWQSHPRWWWQADSATRGCIPVLTELEALGQGVMATIDSRLAGAGILMLPQELSFPREQLGEDADDIPEDDGDAFMQLLIKSMITPLQNRESAASVVPILVQAPAEFLDKAKLISFAKDLDAQTTPMREAAIRRLALGLETPPEVLLGFGDSNHWSAWQIEESTVKTVIEPKLATICDALTTGFLWPLLQGGDPGSEVQPNELTIWFDTADLTQRPDRGPDARELYDRIALSEEALRREHGFGEDDKPDDEEIRTRHLLALAANLRELAVPIYEELGILTRGTIEVKPEPEPAVDAEVTGEENDGDRALPPAPEGGPPARDDDAGPPAQNAAGAVSLAADVAVVRALEIAGKRMRSKNRPMRGELQPAAEPWLLHTVRPVPAAQLDYALEGAWTSVQALCPQLARHVPMLDTYVRQLLQAGVAHESRFLTKVLAPGADRVGVPGV